MDKHKHTDENMEHENVGQLSLEFEDLPDDGQDAFDNQESVTGNENGEYAAEEDSEATEAEADVPHQMEAAPGKRPKNHGLLPAWAVALINILVGGVIIVTFALFHHVLPAMISAREREETKLHATEPPIIATEALPTEAAVEEVTEPDTRTEWQKKFAEHFSDEIILTENSYKSPNVSITVETISYGEGNRKQTYHVADIYIGSIENFGAYVAGGDGSYYSKESIEQMSRESNAIVAICGDYITLQRSGFLLRNGKVIYETGNTDSICALFPDGTIETYEGYEYSIEDIKNRGAIQVWSFGPTLLDENGQVRKNYKMAKVLSYHNPRSALGYYEPGHYCFVVADGRQNGYAKGLTIPELAQIFVDLGCTKAYNLDGGGSAVMAFNHKAYSKQSNGGRDLGDILLIRETPEFLASLGTADHSAAIVTEEGVG